MLRGDTCMMVTCPHGRMSYNDNTEPPNVNTRLGWLAAFIRFISGHICGGLLKCTFPTFKILRRICKINRTLALIEQINIERKRNTKFLSIENTNNGNYYSWISIVQHSWLFVMLSTNCYCECEKGSFFGNTNKILTNRIARLHKTNIYYGNPSNIPQNSPSSSNLSC